MGIKRTFIVLSALILAGALYSQDVKFKKDLFQVEGIDAGYVYDYKDAATGDEGYYFTDLSRKDTLWVYKRKYAEGTFFDISASFSKKKSEIDFDKIVFTLKGRNMATNIIVRNYRFFTTAGMDKQRILNYLDAPRVTRPDLLERLRNDARAKMKSEFNWAKSGSEADQGRIFVDGTLELNNGETVKGNFTVYFRQTDDGLVRLGNDGGGFSLKLNDPKKGITYFYNNNGEAKSKVYNLSAVKSFTVNRKDNIEEVYDVIKRNEVVSVISIQSDGGINPDGSGKSASRDIAMRIIETPTMTLHFRDGVYFISKPEQDAMPILTDQVKEQLFLLAEKCPEVSTKVDNNYYDGYTRAKLIQYVQDYNACANNPFK